MSVPPPCNAHGVYEATEIRALPHKSSACRVPLAEIKLARLGEYWIWAASFQMSQGDCHGSSSPLMDMPIARGRSCRAPTRESAIEGASAYLRERLGPKAETSPDARAVLAWLETLNPNQLNLFGAAA